ncbi:MAG: DUF2274 domain-containing protein [Burkholderiaceae bacterium]
MTKLKLGDLAEDKPVRLTIELPASVHRDLEAYGRVLAETTGGGQAVPLIAPMLERFMATDRGFRRHRPRTD